MDCPNCGQRMENLGNLSGTVFPTDPPQWDDTHVCFQCRVKAKVRRRAKSTHLDRLTHEMVGGFKEVKGE